VHVPVPKEVTSDTPHGDDEAVVEQVYRRLRKIAGRIMQSERPGHTLWPTEVVHEAMAKALAGDELKAGDQRTPVEMIAQLSHAMRQVLIDHHRHRNAIKRGRGRARVSLDEIDDFEAAIESDQFDWPQLDAALAQLAKDDPRRHQVVTLRFFGGLDNRQIARQLDVDERTIGRDWAAARLWLKKKLA
jgi:RNA polymerase sigma factor (TIGR02999 family)